MKILSLWTTVFFIASQSLAAPLQVERLARHYLPILEQLAQEKALVNEVLSRDAVPLTAEQSIKMQNRWSLIGISDLKRAYLYNGASATIRNYQSKIPLMFNCFVLDRQGNVVGTVPECKDFLHGVLDEFLKCYNRGQGQVYINPPGLDVSTEIYSVQVSVPVFDHHQTVGVLVASLSLE